MYSGRHTLRNGITRLRPCGLQVGVSHKGWDLGEGLMREPACSVLSVRLIPRERKAVAQEGEADTKPSSEQRGHRTCDDAKLLKFRLMRRACSRPTCQRVREGIPVGAWGHPHRDFVKIIWGNRWKASQCVEFRWHWYVRFVKLWLLVGS